MIASLSVLSMMCFMYSSTLCLSLPPFQWSVTGVLSCYHDVDCVCGLVAATCFLSSVVFVILLFVFFIVFFVLVLSLLISRVLLLSCCLVLSA